MTIVPLAHYLKDFSEWRETPPIGVQVEPLPEEEPLVATAEQPAAEVEQAHALGLEEGRATAQRDYEERLTEQRLRFQQQLADERQVWAGDTGQRLADEIRNGLADVAQSIAHTAVRVLAPFLAERVKTEALADIQANLAVLLAKTDAVTIDINGPEDLLQELRAKLSS